ncbi:MAG: DNA-3-methyladenine glycosylase 2 [Oscillospiraceae bacterium]|nr:DNA-3-methyladenine glycosylase 2 [Oscillospiraceae bacterium]
MEHLLTIETKDFILSKTFECGQYFRFRKLDDESYVGIIDGKEVKLSQSGSTLYVVGNLSVESLIRFFTLDLDYAAINANLKKNTALRPIVEYSYGIHILRQPLFETLITFILSQNNNIKRITGLIDTLCTNYGEALGNNLYDFPSAEVLATLELEEFSSMRFGFRDKYIYDAVHRWTVGDISCEIIEKAPLELARAELMKIKGVGPKVADCTLLFGASRFEAFPEDVWIKRALTHLFPDGLPNSIEPYAGIVQQYIFHYARAHL